MSKQKRGRDPGSGHFPRLRQDLGLSVPSRPANRSPVFQPQWLFCVNEARAFSPVEWERTL